MPTSKLLVRRIARGRGRVTPQTKPEMPQDDDHVMTAPSSRNTERTLFLDFNPRDLVVNWTPSRLSPAGHGSIGLDAVYVPSRYRAEHVARLLDDLPVPDASVYLLPTLASDAPSALSAQGARCENLVIQDPEFLCLVRSLRSVSNPLFAIPEADWDLPLKRNYALWHAHKHRFRRILLLDDDIRGLDTDRLAAGARALSRWVVAGFYVDDFPDTSVVGHVELAIGEPVWPFMSGSCLFVRTDVSVGFFPPIYNEDWIFMAPEIVQGNVCSLGLINQEPYDPFSCLSLSAFQEPGEIIADGLFALLAAGRYMNRFDSAVWASFLSQRRAWLKYLAGHATEPRQQSAIDHARAVCNQITDLDCTGFISDWEQDRAQWVRTLGELR